MRTIYPLVFLFILFSACKKDITADKLSSNDISNATEGQGPIKPPKIVYASTTPSVFIATANGEDESQLTLSFSSKKPGISIVTFVFLAYETDTSDALSITLNSRNITASFKATNHYQSAKAIAFISTTTDIDGAIGLPDDGSSTSVEFTIHYNAPLNSSVKSGDTVSIQLIGVTYQNAESMLLDESVASPLSPEMMITGARPAIGLNIYDSDVLHLGLTRIMEMEYDSYGSVGVNNLPLVIDATNTKFKNNLIVKDVFNHIINTTTVRNKNKYTIQFPAGYVLTGINAQNFYVYANVTEINGQASISASFQKRSNFSWTDVAGGRTTPFTVENEIYNLAFPSGLVTVTQN